MNSFNWTAFFVLSIGVTSAVADPSPRPVGTYIEADEARIQELKGQHRQKKLGDGLKSKKFNLPEAKPVGTYIQADEARIQELKGQHRQKKLGDGLKSKKFSLPQAKPVGTYIQADHAVSEREIKNLDEETVGGPESMPNNTTANEAR